VCVGVWGVVCGGGGWGWVCGVCVSGRRVEMGEEVCIGGEEMLCVCGILTTKIYLEDIWLVR